MSPNAEHTAMARTAQLESTFENGHCFDLMRVDMKRPC